MTPMKSIHRIFALATLAATAFLSPALHAQIADGSRVNVPFAFNCGTQHFAPGTYTVSFLDKNILRVSSYGKTALAMIQADTDARGSGDGYVVFRKYGNRYFLAEYHPADSLTSAVVIKSKTERSVAHDYAAFNQTDTGRVRLALLETGSSLSSGR